MASDGAGSRPSHLMIIPNTKRHPNNTKTDQLLPIFRGVITGLPRPYHNTLSRFFAMDTRCALSESKKYTKYNNNTDRYHDTHSYIYDSVWSTRHTGGKESTIC